MPKSRNSSTGVDKDALYGQFQHGEDWQSRLSRKLAHKSLDIADDDMDVNVQNTKSGIGWRELAVAAVAGLTGFGMWQYSQQPTPPADPVEHASPVDSEYEVRFYDADGNPIDVPHISTRKDDA